MNPPARETRHETRAASGLRPGAIAPDFTLPAVPGGEAMSVDSVLGESKPLGVVIFWSAVCSHCRRYDAFLGGFGERYPEIGLLAVASRRSETAESLARALEDRWLRFPLVFDEDLAMARAWGVRQTPTAFLLDGDRRVLYRGAIDDFTHPDTPSYRPYLESAIADALSDRPLAMPESAAFGCPVDSVYYAQIGSSKRDGRR
jgi:peroxiredoxin